MRRTYMNLAFGLICVFIFLFLLYRFSSLPNLRLNGFKRTWVTLPLQAKTHREIKTPITELTGQTSNKLFFRVKDPRFVISIDKSLEHIDTLQYGLSEMNKDLGASFTIVDSPTVLFFAQNIPAMFRGKLNKGELEVLHLKNMFTKGDKLYNDRIVLRSLDSNYTKQTFEIIHLQSGNSIAKTELIPNQKLGGFEFDGLLKFDSASKHIFYIENYRNNIYCLDTNLNLLYKANTIDTITTPELEMKEIKLEEKNRIMPITPRVQVNKFISIAKGYIWILSGLKSDSETSNDFRDNTPIDLYQITDGKYIGSVQIQSQNREKIKSFAILNNDLYIQYEKSIAIFPLDF